MTNIVAAAVRKAVLLLMITACARFAVADGVISRRVEDHLHQALEDGLTPTDYHHLVMMMSWRDTLADWRWVTSALDRMSVAATVDPLMVDEVRTLRADVATDQGRPAAAREFFRASGGLDRWWAAGPTPLPELADFHDSAIHPADGVEWRAVEGSDPRGWIRLAALGWPANRQILVLATTVNSGTEQAVAVRLGAAQAARVWINGREILTTPHPLVRSEDQASGGGWLRAGDNLLAVAVASESDDWWLRVRLTAPDGGPLTGVKELSVLPKIQPAADRQPPEVRSIEGEIRSAVAAGNDDALMALAAYLVIRRPEAVGSGGARAACRAARAEFPAEARLLESLLISEPGGRRELLEAAVEADRDLAWARVLLAEWYQDRGLYQVAADLIGRDAEGPALEAAALSFDADLWGQLALPGLARVSRAAPGCVKAAQILAERAVSGNRWAMAREALQRLQAVVPGSLAARELASRLASSCGDGETLRWLLEGELERDPNRPGVRIRLARLYSAEDEVEAARAVLTTGLDRCPEHGALLMETARLEHAAGNEDRAGQLASRMLELRPQDRSAQRLLERLGERIEDRGWVRSPAEIWQLADAAGEDGPAISLLDHHEVRFLPGNLVEERVQQAVLITVADQADGLLRHDLAWVPERQRLRVLAARILRRDGTEISARQGDTPRLSEPEFNLYYDTRMRVLRFEDFEDGDLVEITYVLSETSEANETGPYKGGLLFVGSRIPTALVEIELSGELERLPEWELAHLSAEPERIEQADGNLSLRWTFRDVPALPADVPPAPSLLMTPHLAYSNHPQWGGLADWYARHVAPRIRVSHQVEEKALQLTRSRKDRRSKIDAIYRFVTDDIRYVGLELGEHRFRPFSADWVLQHRIGDCKDKAALLVAMLAAVDIPARMVMVRTADMGPVVTSLALLEQFNHAIAYLPQDDLWLDGTASGHDMSLPPGQDQGARVLVVDGYQSRPQTTPIPGAGVARYRFQLEPGEGATVLLRVHTKDTGDAASQRRSRLFGSNDPRRVARWLQSIFPGADPSGEPELRVAPGRDPVEVKIEASVGRGALLGGGLRIYPGRLELASRLAPGRQRHGPLLLMARPDLEWTLEVDLGRAAGELPEEIHLESPFGSLDVEISRRATGYSVDGQLLLKPGIHQPSEAGAIRDFLVEVERVLGRPLEVP